MKYEIYSEKFKLFVVEYMYKNYLSNVEATIKFGIPSTSTVAGWERIQREEGVNRFMKNNRGRKRNNGSNNRTKT